MKALVLYLCLFVGLLLIVPKEPVDFTAVYRGVEALVSGESPYSESVTERNQLEKYGRLAFDDEDQMRIAHPLTSLLLLAPIGWLDFEAAKAIFIALSATLLISGLHQLGAKLWWAILLCLLLREPLVAFFLGQIALLSSAMIVWGLVMLKKRCFRAAQLFMIVASVHPVLSVPIALLTLKKRTLYITIMLALLCASLLMDYTWPFQWLSTAKAYPGYVNYMVWLPSITPAIAILGVLLLFFREYQYTLAGLTFILPLTGAYHMTLYTPVFLRPTFAIIPMIAALWALPVLSSDTRVVVTPLVFACFSIIASTKPALPTALEIRTSVTPKSGA